MIYLEIQGCKSTSKLNTLHIAIQKITDMYQDSVVIKQASSTRTVIESKLSTVFKYKLVPAEKHTDVILIAVRNTINKISLLERDSTDTYVLSLSNGKLYSTFLKMDYNTIVPDTNALHIFTYIDIHVGPQLETCGRSFNNMVNGNLIEYIKGGSDIPAKSIGYTITALSIDYKMIKSNNYRYLRHSCKRLLKNINVQDYNTIYLYAAEDNVVFHEYLPLHTVLVRGGYK